MDAIENIIPVFPVKNIRQSIEFYVSALGFKVDWDAGDICSVSRDGHCLMLRRQSETPLPSMAWLGLQSDRLMETCLANDVPVVQQPRNDDWAYHLKISDPDGNILWLGTGPKDAD